MSNTFTFNLGGHTRLGGVLEVLNVYTDTYIKEVRSKIPSPGQIEHGALYGNGNINITGDDLLVIHVAISQHCMHFAYEPHEHGGYHETHSKLIEKFSNYFDEVIRPIAILLGLNTTLGIPTQKNVGGTSYYVRALPNNYTSSDPKFIEKLLSAVYEENIAELAKTITLQN